MTANPAIHAPETVRFELDKNLMVIDVVINGVSMPFVLDTGASTTVVTEGTVERLALQAGESQTASACGAAGGPLSYSPVNIDSLAVGELRVENLSCGAMNLEAVTKLLDGEIGGVLGYDFLSNFKITIDYRARQLTFAKYAA